MKRAEAWRLTYRHDRYMRHLRAEDLEQRLRDIVLNYVELVQGRKIGLVPLDEGGAGWIELFTHVLEEYHFRFGDYPAGFRDGLLTEATIPLPNHPDAEKALALVAARALPSATFLAKYSKVQYLEPALAYGKITISPASSYDDTSLDPARQADELKVSVQIPGDQVEIRVINSETGQPEATLPKPAWLTYTRGTRTDYYVYCMSAAWKPRLFLDFQANACLLITKPAMFLDRLAQTVLAELPPGAQVGHGPVAYYDPLRTHPKQIHVGTMKHFRYAYQREYRVIWIPLEPASKLSRFSVKLGSLEDCCELVVFR